MTLPRAGIIVDNLGSLGESPEEEADFIIRALKSIYDFPCEMVQFSTDYNDIGKKNIDLLILDFGGLTSGYGTGHTIGAYQRNALKWADEHPGKLLLIWTAFTAHWIIEDIGEDFGGRANVLAVDTLGKSFDERIDHVSAVLRDWYGTKKSEYNPNDYRLEEPKGRPHE